MVAHVVTVIVSFVTGAEAMRAEAELRELNQVLEQRAVELELASKHKSDLLTSLSHELRIPLNAIIGFSEIMLDHDLPADQRQTYLAQIQRGGQHLLGLVNDILDLARVEAGHRRPGLARLRRGGRMLGDLRLLPGVRGPSR